MLDSIVSSQCQFILLVVIIVNHCKLTMSQEIAPTVTFNNGEKFPQIGLGTWRTQGDEMTHVIKTAIDQGYRMIDTAYSYRNEKIVGDAIKSKIKEGVIKRDDVFVVSKLWITDQRPSKIVESCKRSLFNLGLDYVDLYLIHWPTAFKHDDFGIMDAGKKSDFDEGITLEEKWDKMEECVKLGLAKSIGVSNFNSEQIDRILKIAKIKPVTNQVECHPYFNQKKLIQFCKERDIIITAYAPFGSPSKPKTAFTEIIPVITDEPKVIEIAKTHNKTPGQIILRYLVQLGVVPIPKSSNEKRMAENLKIFDFELDSNEVASMDSLNKNLRSFPFKLAQNHRDYPFDLEF